MAVTLRTVLDDIAAIIDQDTDLASGTDLTVRVNLINQAQTEWANAYQWSALRFRFAPSVTLSMTSIGLPTNFKKLMSVPWDYSDGFQYGQLNPSDVALKTVSDKYVLVRGNLADGQYLLVNPPLASGVSLVFEYQAFPSSLVTLQDVVVVPNPQYLVKRALANLFAARSDSRFPVFKAEADDMLSSMIEEEQTPSGGETNRVPNQYAKSGFRVGQ